MLMFTTAPTKRTQEPNSGSKAATEEIVAASVWICLSVMFSLIFLLHRNSVKASYLAH